MNSGKTRLTTLVLPCFESLSHWANRCWSTKATQKQNQKPDSKTGRTLCRDLQGIEFKRLPQLRERWGALRYASVPLSEQKLCIRCPSITTTMTGVSYPTISMLFQIVQGSFLSGKVPYLYREKAHIIHPFDMMSIRNLRLRKPPAAV